jgi:hypothetical protein
MYFEDEKIVGIKSDGSTSYFYQEEMVYLADDEEEDSDEKEFSMYTNKAQTRLFSDKEDFTDYMVRLYSEEADQDEIEKAIESGDQIESDNEVITPVDDKTAVVEDKNNGEFTKATIKSEDEIEVNKISEEEAGELTDGAAQEEDKNEDKQFSYSKDPVLDKFFADIATNQVVPAVTGQIAQPVQTVTNAQGNQVPVQVDPNTGETVAVPVGTTVEEAEDKAAVAIQSIQAAAAEAAATIAEAKAAPVENAEPDLQEATFSETQKNFSEVSDNQLVSWLNGIKK